MLDVFLCHSPVDRERAIRIATRLESTAEARVLFEETTSIPLSWEAGLGSSAILLLLSPDAVPARINRQEWEPLLNHLAGNGPPPVACVLVRDCSFPRLLERRSFFRSVEPALPLLRQIECWAIAAHPERVAAGLQPATLPWFAGHQGKLEELWTALVDTCGVVSITGPAGSGKTCLAQQFAHQAHKHFRDILWICCHNRSLASIASEVAWRLGVVLDGSVEGSCFQLAAHISSIRQLLIFDGVTCPIHPLLPSSGNASVIVTTRTPASGHSIAMERAALVHTRLPERSSDWSLWRAASACRAQDFPLSLATAMAGLDDREGLAAAQRLCANRILDSLGALRFRLAATHREPDFAKHAETLHTALRKWSSDPATGVALLGEVDAAYQWASVNDWRQAIDLACWSFGLLQFHRRTNEAVERMELLLREAERRGDDEVAASCKWEMSWIRSGSEAGVRLPDASAEQLVLAF